MTTSELIKCKRKSANPFVGYRSLKNPKQKFSTESVSIWHDRRLLDSLVITEDELVILKKEQKTGKKAEKDTRTEEQRKKDFDKLFK